jgi:hypothetical protein
MRILVSTLVVFFLLSGNSAAFQQQCDHKTLTTRLIQQQHNHDIQHQKVGYSRLCMSSSNNNQFDISRPTFDLLSLRQMRGDAIVRYDSLNQSEPLRILLFGLFAVAFAIAPTFTEAVGYDSMDISAIVVSIVGSIISGTLFVRECKQRSKQLSRIEKELNTERLPIRLPTNALAEMPFTQPISLKELRSTTKSPPRIIAICGNKAKLIEALSGLAIYGQRLVQASTYVVPVSTDGSTGKDWKVLDPQRYKSWLADPYQQNMWLDYFADLSSTSTTTDTEFRWFGLTSRGQSFGSGEGQMPQWLQVLGQFLRPTDFLDETDTSVQSSNIDPNQQELLQNVDAFYKALTTGDKVGIDKIYSKSVSDEVSEVINAGGRIDSWKDCLVEGARPSDMQVSGADVTIFPDTEAFTTVVEFPANTGFDSATLLAVQRWTRPSKDDPWQLELHQTIPWSLEAKAQGTLRCDCRGCVALTRTPEKRTFGGIIG